MTSAADRRGFTLTEMIVGMVVAGVLGTALVSLLRVQNQTYSRQNAGVLATQNARAALEMMAREMRNAAYDPYDDSPAAVTAWTTDSFGFTADLNEDGDVDDADEAITYFHDANAETLVRRANGVDGVMADRVTAVEFSYFRDESGTAATAADEIEQVRMGLEYETADGALAGVLETAVALRNQIY